MQVLPHKNQTRKSKKILQKIGLVLVAFLIFVSGWGVGNGIIGIPAKKINTNKQLPSDLNYKTVEQVYDSLKSNFDGELSESELLDGLKQGLAKASKDPYTEYLNIEDAKEFSEDITGTFTGIGAELEREEKNIIIVSPISGFPAEKAGLRPRDIVAEIDGNSAYDISVQEAVKKIRGPENTVVKLKIVRSGSQVIDVEITRAKISIPSVEQKILDGNIGYVKISRYGDDTTRLVRDAALSFKSKNVKGVILDVRNDPGGLLDAAVDVSNIWLEKGKTILEEKRGNVVVKQFNAKNTPILKGVPTVVLINDGSASASEITAGALRDNNVATLIGVKSFGKGSVQQLVNFGDGTVLKVTIARWYTPSGKNIDKEGINPDQEVKLTEEDAKAKRDPQLDAAIQRLRQ
ncbi:MAG: S41 family peptidase [Patescibacteria group bacterium]